MRIQTILRLTAGTFLLSATSAQAQEPVETTLVGNWALSVEDSSFGLSRGPDSAVMVVSQADDKVVMSRTNYHSAFGKGRTIEFDMSADGEVHEATTDEGSTEARASWDDDVLEMWLVGQSNVGDLEISERIWLTDNGERLRIDRVMQVPGVGELEQSLIYIRR